MALVIYQAFSRKYIPKDEEDCDVYINIKKSWIHKLVSHPPIFPCAKTIEWILQCTDDENMRVKRI